MGFSKTGIYIKQLLPAVFIICLLLACSSEKSENYDLEKSTAYIAGKVLNHPLLSADDAEFVPQFVKVLHWDIIGQPPPTIVSQIESDGRYLLEFSLMNPKTVWFNYGTSGYSVFVKPGDTLTFNFEAKKELNQKFHVDNATIQFEGLNSELNTKYIKYQEQIKPLFTDVYGKLLAASSLEEFMKLCRDYRKTKSAESITILNELKASNLLRELVGYDIEYENYYLLLAYHPENIEVPDTYFDFLNDSLTHNDNALISNQYIEFLHYVKMYLNPKFTPSFNKVAGHLMDNTKLTVKENNAVQKLLNDPQIDTSSFYYEITNAHPDVAEIFKKYQEQLDSAYLHYRINRFLTESKGMTKDIFLTAEVFFWIQTLGIKPVKANWESYLSNIDTPYLRARAIDRLNEEIIVNSQLEPEDAVIHESDFVNPDFYNEIISKYKGKVIYIDIWGTWCMACIHEFNYSKKLQSHFDKKNLVFVYLCVRSDKKLWQRDIKKYGLKGEHYLLNDNQYDLLAKKFEIYGIPHYVLVDKTGKINQKDALRPSQTAELREEIDKLLLKN